MAEKRMFAKTIVLSDDFLDLPMSTRCLYFTLGMLADDDGFINNPKSIMRQCGSSVDDMKLLIAKRYVLEFETGVIVIRHWRINNYLRNDRYTETNCIEEKSDLVVSNDVYYSKDDVGIPVGIPGGIPNIDKNREDKNSIDKSSKEKKPTKHKHGEFGHVLLTDAELQKLTSDYGEIETLKAIKYLDEYCELYGKSYKNYNLAMRKWVYDAIKTKNVTIDMPKTESKTDTSDWQ